MSHRLIVLGWHNVEGTWAFPSPAGAGVKGLERQLLYLKRIANVVPLEDALRTLHAGQGVAPRAVSLTFDDGYRDNLELAVPLLERFDLPATFFLVPGLLSDDVEPWWEIQAWAFARATRGSITWEENTLPLDTDKLRRSSSDLVAENLKRRDRTTREQAISDLVSLLAPDGWPQERAKFLDWPGAQEIVGKGFAVGSHTLHHPILSEESSEQAQRELTESRAVLENKLGADVMVLAYPNGTELDYNASTVAAAAAAGYTHAVTMRPGWNGPSTPPFEIRRFYMTPEEGVKGLGAVPRHLLDGLLRKAVP